MILVINKIILPPGKRKYSFPGHQKLLAKSVNPMIHLPMHPIAHENVQSDLFIPNSVLERLLHRSPRRSLVHARATHQQCSEPRVPVAWLISKLVRFVPTMSPSESGTTFHALHSPGLDLRTCFSVRVAPKPLCVTRRRVVVCKSSSWYSE